MSEHLIDGEFQSDKYPTTPRGKVPLSCKDPTAQDLLWEYAQRRRVVDAAFADDLEAALKTAGFNPKIPSMSETKEPFTGPFTCVTNDGLGDVLDANEEYVVLDKPADEAQWLCRKLNAPAPDVRLSEEERELVEQCRDFLLPRDQRQPAIKGLLDIIDRITGPKP